MAAYKKKKEAMIERAEGKMHEESECVDFIASRKKDSNNYLRFFQDKWSRYYQMYQSIPSSNQNYKGRANLFIPYAYSTIETIMPRLFVNQPKLLVAPRRPEDIVSSKDMQRAVDYYWDQMKMKEKIKDWGKDMLIYGAGVVKLIWCKEDNYDGPKAMVLDIAGGEVFFDPTATDLNDPNTWWIHEYKEDIESIKNNSNYQLPQEEVEDRLEAMAYSESINDYYKNFRDFISGITPGKDSKAKKALIWEYWGMYEDEDGEMKPHIITILNKQYIIRKELNPYKHGQTPFTVIYDIKMPHEPLGIGEIEPIESLQYELNDTRNQRMDNVTLILHRMFKIQKGADVDEDELVWRPGGHVHVGDMAGLEPIDVPDVTRSSYNEETLIKSDIQLATGINDMSSNVGSKSDTNASNTTVRGLAMTQEIANARFQLKLDNIEDGLKRFGTQLIGLIQQYMPNYLSVRMKIGDAFAWRKLTRKEIAGEYDFSVEMGATQPMNRMTRRAEARDLIATVAPYLQQMGGEGMKKMNQYLKFLEETYDMPAYEEEMQSQMPGMMGMGQEVGSTPGQAGPNLAPYEQQYGAQGAALGGASPSQGSSNLQPLV